MPTNDIDILEELGGAKLPITNKPSTATITVKNNNGTYSCISTKDLDKYKDSCTKTALRGDDPEYEVIGLTFRQKLALRKIIFKAWLRRILGIE